MFRAARWRRNRYLLTGWTNSRASMPAPIAPFLTMRWRYRYVATKTLNALIFVNVSVFWKRRCADRCEITARGLITVTGISHDITKAVLIMPSGPNSSPKRVCLRLMTMESPHPFQKCLSRRFVLDATRPSIRFC